MASISQGRYKYEMGIEYYHPNMISMKTISLWPNTRLHPTPLRGPKIGSILQSGFVPTDVPTYVAARVKRIPFGGLFQHLD